jgi:hypothetical protein
MNELTIAELEELIADAKACGATDDTPVHFSYNYGDHWRTTVAPSASNAELLYVERSDYHQMDKLTEDEGELESDRQVFVIS